jgi:hypothetical protein
MPSTNSPDPLAGPRCEPSPFLPGTHRCRRLRAGIDARGEWIAHGGRESMRDANGEGPAPAPPRPSQRPLASGECPARAGDLRAAARRARRPPGGHAAALAAGGVALAGPVTEQAWGRAASIALGDGSEIGICQPGHPRPGKSRAVRRSVSAIEAIIERCERSRWRSATDRRTLTDALTRPRTMCLGDCTNGASSPKLPSATSCSPSSTPRGRSDTTSCTGRVGSAPRSAGVRSARRTQPAGCATRSRVGRTVRTYATTGSSSRPADTGWSLDSRRA